MAKGKKGGGKKRKGGSTRFYSKAQWRWAFATKQPWARRHAHRTPGPKKVRYRVLPRKKHPGKNARTKGR